jgi:hypothetical protein
MTTKLKALELFDKYYEVTNNYYESKQCALIAADEMLIEYSSQCPKDSYEMERHLYWNEVKKEIEKL